MNLLSPFNARKNFAVSGQKSEVRGATSDRRRPLSALNPPTPTLWLFVLALALLLPGRAQAAALTLSPSSGNATPIDDKSTSTPFQNLSITHSSNLMPLTGQISFPRDRGALAPVGSFTVSNDVVNVYYKLSGVVATNVQALVRALVYTPVENRISVGSSETTTFNIVFNDTNSVSDSATVNLNVSAANDAPHLLGLSSIPAALNDNVTTQLFTGVTVQDVDNLGAQTVTLTVSWGESAPGTFQYQGADTNKVTLSGTPTNVMNALQALVFTASSNRFIAGQVYTRGLEITLVDQAGANAPENTTKNVTFTSLNDPPSATITLSPGTFNDNVDVQPFRITLRDGDLNDTLRVVIQPINDPTYYFGSLSTNGPFTGPNVFIQGAIQSVHYTPVPNRVTNSQTIDLRFVVTDSAGASGSVTGRVTVLAVNDPPAITGVSINPLYITDDPNQPPFHPFPTVNIGDPDAGETNVVVNLTVSDPSRGSLSQSNFSGSAPQVTAAVRATTFSPLRAPNRDLGKTLAVSLTIAARDGGNLSSSNSQTIINITSVNASPVIFVPTNQPVLIPPAPLVGPFTNVFVQDDDVDFTYTTNGGGTITTNSAPSNGLKVSVWLDDPMKGVLTNLGGFVYTNGIYLITTNAAAATRALTNLLFDVNDDYLFPPSEPGGTRFTIKAVDGGLRQNARDLQILLQNLPVNRLVTSVFDDGLPGSLRYAVTNSGNNDVITFALAKYPETIRLDPELGPMELRRNLNFKGPGADLLAISGDTDGDGDADTQLFRVFASVNFDGLTFTKGKGAPATDGPQTGGAIFVGRTGRLTMRNCAVTDSQAAQWGGGIDVAGGSLTMDRCLVRGNATDTSLGLGGGGISLYTAQDCSFANTTFSANRQRSAGGYGGGALYAENPDAFVAFNVTVVHCTFAENVDAASLGSAIGANGFGTEVHVRNSILNNTAGQNLEEQGAALIVSDGGNVARDSTRTILTQGGVPRDIVILDKASDRTDTDPLLLPLASTKPTASYPLQATSPAISRGVGDFEPTDQNDAARDNLPAAGAVGSNANRQLVLNEIHFIPSTSGVQFLEFYLRRTATSSLDIGGYTLWIDGALRHEFAAGNPTNIIQPGRGIVLADSIIPAGDPANGNPTVVVRPRVGTNTGTLQLGQRGVIELRRPDPALPSQSRVVFSRAYVGVFEPLIIPSTSLTLAPQFVGFALLPHWKVNPGITNSPGRDAFGTPFGGDNAPPIAVADTLLVGEDDLRNLAVLANDTDADGGDVRFIVDVSRAASQGGNDAATNSLSGATVRVDPSNLPLRGTNIIYDPRHATNIQRLAEGATLVDEFYYSILDYGSGVPVSYASTNNGTNVLVQSPSHRLTNGEPIVISGAGTPGYNGTFAVISNNVDSFLIRTNFVDNPAEKGYWLTVGTRHPTQRSEARVSLTILGANDPPTPAADTNVATLEDVTIRIMADAILAGTTNVVFDTDPFYVPPPVVSPVSLLANDTDPDTDDNKNTLKVVGVAGEVFAVSNYLPTETNDVNLVPLVRVIAPNHGLFDAQKVLISGYGGHPSYNALHAISVVDSNSFTLPIQYVDNEPAKGTWGVLDDATRLTAKSHQGADVKLEIRADRIETSIIYNPRVSEALNHLGLGQHTNDAFYYVAQDSHGALAFAQVIVDVTGVNDLPVPRNDPTSLSQLDSLVSGSNTLGSVVDGLEALYFLPPGSGNTNRVDVQVDSGGQGYFLGDIWTTLEDRALAIPASVLLGNDSDVDYVDLLSISAVSSLSHQRATVTLTNGGATVIYNPAASTNLNKLAREELEVDAFEITVRDGAGGFVTNLVAVLVVGVNDPPVARDDQSGTPEDVAISFDPRYFPTGTTNSALWDSDVDINGHLPDNQLTLIPVANFTTPGGARVDIRTNTFFYDPSVSAFLNGLAFNQTFNDTFTYTVTDGSFLFAQNDLFQVQADGIAYVLNVLVNDVNYNPQGGNFRILSVGTPNHGGTNFNNGTNVVYAPEVNFVGDEVFPYTVVDEAGNLDTGLVTVRVTVNQLNGQLQANNDDFSVAKGESVELDVLANDNIVPTPGSLLTIVSVTTPSAGGTASVAGGRIAYTPSPTNLSGMYLESFTYEISGGGTARATALVTLTVTNRTDTLAIQDDAFAVPSASRSNVLDVLFNDGILPAGNAGLTIYSISTNGLHGLAKIAADGLSIIYTPETNFVGLETNLTYVAIDTVGGSGSGRVSVSVGNLATCPDAFVVNTTNTTLLEVLANDRQLQGPAVTLTLLGVSPASTALGTVSVQGNQLQFIPNGTVGTTDLTYTVADGAGGTAPGRVAIETATAAAGEQLFASRDTYSVLRGSVGNTLDVLANDAAVPDFHRPITIVSTGTGLDAPNHGGNVTVSVDSRSLLYTPAPGFSGEETFTYTMTDSRQTDTAKIIVKVGAGSLIAGDDEFTVYFETNSTGPLQFTLPVMANDKVQPNFGQFLSITGVGIDDTNAANAPDRTGLVAISGDATALLYTPQDTHPPYVERFTYEITDGTARRAQGVVQVRVQLRTNVRDIETHNDLFTVAANSSSNFLAVLVNDGVKPGSASLWTVSGPSSPPSHGVAQAVPGGFVYWPNAGFVGTDHFQYTVADGVGGTGAGEVTVKVGQVDVSADSFAVLSGTTNNLLWVVANDFLAPSDGKVFLIGGVGVPDRGGSAAATTNGLAILYRPNPNYGTNVPALYPYQERFWYDLLDDSGGTMRGLVTVDVYQNGSDRDPALITMTVQGVNDAPTITNTVPPPLITDKMTGTPFANVRIHDVDNQGMELLTVTVIIDDVAKGVLTNLGGFVQGPAGTYTINGTPTNVTTAIRGLVFVPTENRSQIPVIENTVFTIRANDTHVTTTYIVTQPVQAVNDPPVISGTRSNQTVYRLLTIKPFSSVTVTEVDYFTLQPLVVTVALDNPTHGFLNSLGAFVDLGGGVYRIGATNAGVTAAAASAALRALVFNPTTAARVTPGSPETTRFTITVEDGYAAPVTDNNTTVIAFHEFQTKALASDGVGGDNLGFAVAASRDVVVAGAPQADPRGNSSGAAFIYTSVSLTSTQWTQFQKLSPADGAAGDEFGNAVAISGNTIAVGAHANRPATQTSGAVYVFERATTGSNSWALARKVVPFDGANSDDFGFFVSLDQDTLVVGARADDDSGSSSGSAYVYSRNQGGSNNWGFVKKLVASDAAAGDEFGFSAAVEGDTIIVGSHFDAPGGSAYLFRRNQGGTNNWGQIKKLIAPDGLGSDEFGRSVGISGDMAVVGAPQHDAPGNDTGTAYLYKRDQGGADNWGFFKELFSPTGLNGDQFGYSVSLNHDKVVVGLPFSGIDNQSRYGNAYAYARNTGGADNWGILQTLTRSDPANNDQFGIAVAIGQGTVVVGANMTDARGGDSGSVYIYRLKYNNAPRLVVPIPNQTAGTNSPFTFTLAAATFGDPDVNDPLTLSATLSDGSPLPPWLSFNAATATFSGTPPVAGLFTIRVTATDEDGVTTSATFTLTIGGNALRVSPPPPLYVIIGRDPQNGQLQLRYDRPIGTLSSSYRLQISGDGTIWNSGDALVLFETTAELDAETEQVTLRVSLPPSNAQFFRIETANE